MIKRHIIIFSAALLLLAGSALAQDVSGEWDLTSEGRQGPQTQTIKIEQDGEKITRTMRDMEMTTTYTGTVDGDAMSGKMVRGMGERMGESEWTAKKK